MVKSKGKILLVEDDQAQIFMYSTKFSSGGYEVVSVSDPDKAESVIEREQPDLILLDLIVGWLAPMTEEAILEKKGEKLEGIKVLRKLNKNPRTNKIPVIIFTNLDPTYLKDAGERWKADGYIIKANFTPTEILEKIDKFLSDRKKKVS